MFRFNDKYHFSLFRKKIKYYNNRRRQASNWLWIAFFWKISKNSRRHSSLVKTTNLHLQKHMRTKYWYTNFKFCDRSRKKDIEKRVKFNRCLTSKRFTSVCYFIHKFNFFCRKTFHCFKKQLFFRYTNSWWLAQCELRIFVWKKKNKRTKSSII